MISDATGAGHHGGHGATIMNTLDFSRIEEMDPSTADGFQVCYDRECPFEMRLQHEEGGQEVGPIEAVKVKILIKGEDGETRSVRIELSSENDLFFHFAHSLDDGGFVSVQEEQKLMIDFPQYAAVLIKMLNNCIKEPESHLAVFVILSDGRARLDFIQNMEYKFVELLSAMFVRSSDEVVRQQITYRYNAMKSRLAIMQARLTDVNNLVKVKNPSLLLQLTKPPRAHRNNFRGRD